jgi:ferritin
MICEICNTETGTYEVDGVLYVKICRVCINSSYKEGIYEGFKLAGRNIDELASVYKKENNIKTVKEIQDFITKHMESESILRCLMSCDKQVDKKEKKCQ